MNAVKAFLKRFFVDASAAVAIEYAMICLLVFLAIIGAINMFVSSTNVMYAEIVAAMTKGSK